MFKNLKVVVLAAVMVVFGGTVIGAEGDAGNAQLEAMTLQGAIVQKVTQTKSGQNRTYYYLKQADENQLKLANQTNGKKGFDDAMKVDLKSFVDKSVQLNVKASKTKTGKVQVKYITQITEL